MHGLKKLKFEHFWYIINEITKKLNDPTYFGDDGKYVGITTDHESKGCESCKHPQKASDEEPCKSCNNFYSKWIKK